MTINERIRYLRLEELHQTQEEFSKCIGISRSSLASVESGRVVATERNIAAICKCWSINEEWLRYGKGQIFSEPQDAIEQLCRAYKLKPSSRLLIEEYVKLPKSTQAAIFAYFTSVSARLADSALRIEMAKADLDCASQLDGIPLEQDEQLGTD